MTLIDEGLSNECIIDLTVRKYKTVSEHLEDGVFYFLFMSLINFIYFIDTCNENQQRNIDLNEDEKDVSLKIFLKKIKFFNNYILFRKS